MDILQVDLAVKRAVIEVLEQQRPDVPATLTQNALDNRPMLAVNDLLGYVALEYFGEFQRPL